jgi:hypothetical protein
VQGATFHPNILNIQEDGTASICYWIMLKIMILRWNT